ncbi:PHP-associated domain-containing protein [Bradyrhizobium sp. STM 3557]
MIETGGSDAHRARQIGNAHAVISVAPEQIERCIQRLVAIECRLPAAGPA